jgi:multidrug efflux pump subunit AcrA (membrane-fusion protein)
MRQGRGVMVIRWGILGLVLVFGGWLSLPRAYAATEELNCLIHPFVVITITTPVGGLLESVQVDRGDLVKEGQILARVGSTRAGRADQSAPCGSGITADHGGSGTEND